MALNSLHQPKSFISIMTLKLVFFNSDFTFCKYLIYNYLCLNQYKTNQTQRPFPSIYNFKAKNGRKSTEIAYLRPPKSVLADSF